MANDYYTHTTETRHTLGRAASVNSERAAVEAGFDLLPSLLPLAQARVTFTTETGAADAYAIALATTITAYVAGLEVSFIVVNANTGAATLDVDGVGARSIKMADGLDPVAGDMPAGGLAEFRYDGTNFVMTSQNIGAKVAAAASAVAAAADAASVAALYDSFDDRYLGEKASAPTLDNDGDALLTGALYWNNVSDTMFSWSGSVWVNFSSSFDPSSVAITGGTITGITDLAVADGGTGASTAAGARTNLGLGTMAVQAASAVAITGGDVTGITDITVADGGTGSSTAGGARTNLGLGTIATQAAASVSITGGSITGITDLAVADGGTGASTAAAAIAALGGLPLAGGTMTGDIVLQGDATAALNPMSKQQTDTALALKAPLASPTITGTPLVPTAAPGTNNTQAASTAYADAAAAASGFTAGTKIDTTSGTSHDHTGIAAGTNFIVIGLAGVSTNNTSPLMIQIGDAGGIEATGYANTAGAHADSLSNSTIGFNLTGNGAAADVVSGVATLSRIDGDLWSIGGVMKRGTANLHSLAGDKTLTAELTQLRLTTVTGTPTFDAGAFNILTQ